MELKSETLLNTWFHCKVDDIKSENNFSMSTGPFGSSVSSLFFKKEGIPLIRGSNLSNDKKTKMIENEFVFLSKEKADEFKRSTVYKGDLIFTCWGTINQIGLIDENSKYKKYIISNKQMKLTPDFKKIDSLFLFYYFNSEFVQNQIKILSIGSSIPGFNLTNLKNIKLYIPGLKEQKNITNKIHNIDINIDVLLCLISKKQNIKQAVLQQLLTGQTRLPGFSGEWMRTKLETYIKKYIGGGTPSRSNKEFWNGSIPWVTVKDFSKFHPTQAQEYITEKGLNCSASKLIPSKTLVVCTRMLLGKAVVYEVEVAINQDLKAIIFYDCIDIKYIFYWFNFFGGKLNNIASGSTVKGLSIQDIKQMFFDCPPLDEQQAIAAVLSDMDAEIEALEAQLQKVQAIKQGMMQELLTGKTRLVEPGELVEGDAAS